MRLARRITLLYWTVVGLAVLVIGWWMVFFGRQGAVLVERLDDVGADLNASQVEALLAAARKSQRMLFFEGVFLTGLLFVGLYLVLRSMRAEVLLHQRQRDFLSAVTHELKSPIASARLCVESLRLGRVPEDKRVRYLGLAQDDLDRLSEMVERLLDAARTSAGQSDLRIEELDLAQFAHEAVARFLRAEGTEEGGAFPSGLSRSALDVELVAPAPVAVRADETALESILRNLLSNAVKYGGEPPRVRVSVVEEDGEARLEVRDFGTGVSGHSARARLRSVRTRRKRARSRAARSGFGSVSRLGARAARSAVVCGRATWRMTRVRAVDSRWRLRFPLATRARPGVALAGGVSA